MIEYANKDIVYVPLDRMSQVQRYQCEEGHTPRLDSLRGIRWSQTKARVKKSIEDMTEELLELYSRRELVDGFGYAPDSILSHEFDAAFEYEATPDQLKAIEDVTSVTTTVSIRQSSCLMSRRNCDNMPIHS